MARPLRIQYAGAMYHVMNRGDQREDIFRDDEDREKFLSTLGEGCGKTEWQIHAYCLMSNHFHLVLETPQPNLVFGMKVPRLIVRSSALAHGMHTHLLTALCGRPAVLGRLKLAARD
jgi:REP element-mobilizing transposase RayT